MILNLDQTDITERIVETIVFNLTESGKIFRKIAFVGVNKSWHRKLARIQENGCFIKFFIDYEEAKEWVI